MIAGLILSADTVDARRGLGNRSKGAKRRIAVVAAVASALCSVFVLSGCATNAQHTAATSEAERDVARFYWPYAALAADVYRTAGEVDSHAAQALASPWLRGEIAGNKQALDLFAGVGFAGAEKLYRTRMHDRCKSERAALDADDPFEPPSCRASRGVDADLLEAEAAARAEPNMFSTNVPIHKAQCDYTRGQQPMVPLDDVTEGPNGWSRVPELHKQRPARGWRFFVPELAVDVWRRNRDTADQPGLEYAIVFRGTVGGGGWVSNLRALTWMSPLVWDQYRQSELATRAVIDQLERLHALADELLGRKQSTRLYYTAVGHSLGGGLAKYVYLRVPRITRVVAFDPSPVDGSGTFKIDERLAVNDAGRRFVDKDARDKDAAMHLLYEHGEIMSRVAGCHSGPLWGADGGPIARCDAVNYSSGNPFRQHNMAQLACKLYLVTKDLPAR